MMEFLEHLEDNWAFMVAFLKFLLEVASAFCILLGFLQIMRIVIAYKRQHYRNLFIRIRLSFGQWLVLALELQLGADILATTANPSFADLGKLAAIAAIRTFLNYFLERELSAELKLKIQSPPPTTSSDLR